jgi:hypothetical protein
LYGAGSVPDPNSNLLKGSIGKRCGNESRLELTILKTLLSVLWYRMPNIMSFPPTGGEQDCQLNFFGGELLADDGYSEGSKQKRGSTTAC